MTDEEFLGYCEIHCRTERALFSGSQVDRLNELAGRPPSYVFSHQWVAMRADYAQPCIDDARRRLREAEEKTRDENVLARGFVEGDL